jgi:hypothetical protein
MLGGNEEAEPKGSDFAGLLADLLEGARRRNLSANNLAAYERTWTRDPDGKAAWELYVELLTRIATQYLAPDHRDEKTALDTIFKLFDLTRQTPSATK